MAAPVLDIGVAEPRERRAALELVLTPVSPSARSGVIDAVAGQRRERLGPLDALIVARRRGEVVAAVWAQPSPGNSAGLWPPEAVDPAAAAAAGALVAAAVGAVDTAGVAMLQALFESSDDPRIPVLERAGFEFIAELHYLGRSLRLADAKQTPPTAAVFDPFGSADEVRLQRIIEATYIGTLDCPAMEGRRDPDDVLTGYRATGRHDPCDWFFVRDKAGGDDVGVLLLADHPSSQQYELVYMGLAPAARGRGLGRVVVAEAIRVAALRGAEQLMVAVDAANTPARRVYEAAGFARWSRKLVYVR